MQESIWDASLFLTIEGLGTFSSIVGAVVLILNILCQFTFASIVVLTLMNHGDQITDSTTKRYQFWRINTAHRYQYMVKSFCLCRFFCIGTLIPTGSYHKPVSRCSCVRRR